MNTGATLPHIVFELRASLTRPERGLIGPTVQILYHTVIETNLDVEAALLTALILTLYKPAHCAASISADCHKVGLLP
jgi:hypothetical protein